MQIREAVTDEDFARVRALFREYLKTPGVGVCVTGFSEEVEQVRTRYFAVLLAWEGDEAVGCGALREIGEGRAEMKRLYVREARRGLKAGRALVEALIARAKEQGCARLVLDTLPTMKAAISMYRSLGFEQIAGYCKDNPPDALCFSMNLAAE